MAAAIGEVASGRATGISTPDDVHGGTFTITNPGQFGAVLATPIINQPQVAILDLEAVVKRPVVVEAGGGDSIAIRPMTNLCMSWDHRALDGAEAARFLGDVKDAPGGLECGRGGAAGAGGAMSGLGALEHEELHVAAASAAGLYVVVAIHSTALGPALGGARLWRYAHARGRDRRRAAPVRGDDAEGGRGGAGAGRRQVRRSARRARRGAADRRGRAAGAT